MSAGEEEESETEEEEGTSIEVSVGDDDEEAENEEEETEVEEETVDTQDDDTAEGTVYRYRIPLEYEDGIASPSYDPSIQGGLYLYHYGTNYLTVIQGGGAGHLHRDNVNVQVDEFDAEEVESSDSLIDDYA